MRFLITVFNITLLASVVFGQSQTRPKPAKTSEGKPAQPKAAAPEMPAAKSPGIITR